MSETNYVPNPASPVELNNDFLQGRSRHVVSTRITSSSFFRASAVNGISVHLPLEASADIYVALVDTGDSGVPVGELQDLNVISITKCSPGYYPEPYWEAPTEEGRVLNGGGLAILILDSDNVDANINDSSATLGANSWVDVNYIG